MFLWYLLFSAKYVIKNNIVIHSITYKYNTRNKYDLKNQFFLANIFQINTDYLGPKIINQLPN